jgi:hypothetical protein
MPTTTAIEVALVFLNVICWLGPLFVAATRRSVSLLHPSAAFPLYTVFTLLVAMTEHWFGWSGRWDHPGIRLKTLEYQDLPWFFIEPLVIMCLVGVAFHLGVLMATGRVVAGRTDTVHLDEGFTDESWDRIRLLVIACIGSILCVIPWLLFGQGSGFFWTVGFMYAYSFIPVVVMTRWRAAGVILWFAGMPALMLLDSKANFIYHAFPLAFYFQQKLLYVRGRIRAGALLVLAIMLAIVSVATKELTVRRNEYVEGVPVIYNVLVREYGFEVFAILVHEVRWTGELAGRGSWLALEAAELIPSALSGSVKKRAGVVVAESFMPEDYEYLQGGSEDSGGAGFYRYFAFAFYHDFGWIGAIVGGALCGGLFGAIYDRALRRAHRTRNPGPLLVYLPIPVYCQYYATGNFAFAVIFTAISSVVVGGLALSARSWSERVGGSLRRGAHDEGAVRLQ